MRILAPLIWIIFLPLFLPGCSGGSGDHSPVDNFVSNLGSREGDSDNQEASEEEKQEILEDALTSEEQAVVEKSSGQTDYQGAFKEFYDACQLPAHTPSEDVLKKTALAIQNAVGGLNDSCKDTVTHLEKEDRLILSNKGLSDISMLGEMVHLKRLVLSRNHLNAVGAVGLLENIEELDLSENPVEDFSPLNHLKNLRELRLSQKKPGLNEVSELVSDLKKKAGIPEAEVLSESEKIRLTWEAFKLLRVKTHAVSDLDFLKHCDKLETLSLDFTRVSDLRGLKDCQRIRRLSLQGLKIEDLSSLHSLSELQELKITAGFIPAGAIDRLKSAVPHMLVMESPL